MILDEIAAKTIRRIERKKQEVPLEAVKKKAEALPVSGEFPFEQALKKKGLTFICEVKKASPSKGVIAEDFPYLAIAKDYEKAGAGAISCLTEPYYFKGSDQYLKEIAETVKIPVLRKDFTVDAYMIYEAKLLGASAVLLICAILSDGQLREYLRLAEEAERALAAGVRIIGVNNRGLKTFQVDVDTSIRLRKQIPEERLYVSESGIRTPQDIAKLYENGTDGVLIGETLMRAKDKKAMLDELRGDQ